MGWTIDALGKAHLGFVLKNLKFEANPGEIHVKTATAVPRIETNPPTTHEPTSPNISISTVCAL